MRAPDVGDDGTQELALASSAGAGALAESKGRRAEIESIQNQKVLDTPRTREGCRRLGFVLEDLHFRALSDFYIPGDLKEKQQMRFEHYEKKRKERLAAVLAERAKVIAQNAKKGDVPGVQSGQFLSMLESLFEKEAKRLETDLKGQLRKHSSLVKENEEQLRKEGQLQEKLEIRDQRRLTAAQKVKKHGEETREATDSRLAKNQERNDKLKNEFEDRVLAHQAEILAEEERLQRFELAKAQMSSDKSHVFKEKVEKMKEKGKLASEEKRKEGEAKLQELDMRIQAVEQRRQEDMRMREMRSEEQHLHIMDVREAKARIDRGAAYRRDEVREQIDSNVERIETLLALKDQLLDQRKGRNLKAEATKGARGLNLRRDCLPGPGQYEAPPSCLTELPAARIGKSRVPGMVDDAVRATAAVPAPGSYDTKLMANGDLVDRASSNAVRFGQRDRDSFLDDAVRAKDFVPAPGVYKAESQLDKRAVKMRRERIEDPGMDKFSAKRFPAWARPSTETPGPAGYSVDDYTRKEVLRRAQRSLPNLTKDMLRPGVVK